MVTTPTSTPTPAAGAHDGVERRRLEASIARWEKRAAHYAERRMWTQHRHAARTLDLSRAALADAVAAGRWR